MSVPHVLLRLLTEGPSHGYDLHRKLGAFHHFYPLRNVNVYPTLRELERQGYVHSRREFSESRMRKVYEITPEGQSELRSWIATAPESPLSTEKDLVALKLAVATAPDSPGLGWLADSLASLDEELARARVAIDRDLRRDASSMAQLTAQYRVRAYETRRQYLLDATAIAHGRDPAAEGRPIAKRILVADDSIAARVYSRHLLSAAGYDVRLAEDGAEAWDLLQQDEFDVLVSDALMPQLDGFALLERVRASAQLAGLPVILNTVLEEARDRYAALAAGADDFVCKKEADAARRLVDSVNRLAGNESGATH